MPCLCQQGEIGDVATDCFLWRHAEANGQQQEEEERKTPIITFRSIITNPFTFCCPPTPLPSQRALIPQYSHCFHTQVSPFFFFGIALWLGKSAIALFLAFPDFIISVWLQPLVLFRFLRENATRIIHGRSLSVPALQSRGPRDCNAGTDRRLREWPQ